MNANHADPVSTAIEIDELATTIEIAAPQRKPAIPIAAGDAQVCAIDAMAACMRESSFGG